MGRVEAVVVVAEFDHQVFSYLRRELKYFTRDSLQQQPGKTTQNCCTISGANERRSTQNQDLSGAVVKKYGK